MKELSGCNISHIISYNQYVDQEIMKDVNLNSLDFLSLLFSLCLRMLDSEDREGTTGIGKKTADTNGLRQHYFSFVEISSHGRNPNSTSTLGTLPGNRGREPDIFYQDSIPREERILNNCWDI